MSDLKSRFAAAAEQASKDETWIRLDEAGDRFTMLVDSVTIGESGYGEYPVVAGTLEDGTAGRYAAMRSVVRNEITENPPAKGDILSVRYIGEATAKKSGNTFHNYRVVVMPGELGTVEKATAIANTSDDGGEW